MKDPPFPKYKRRKRKRWRRNHGIVISKTTCQRFKPRKANNVNNAVRQAAVTHAMPAQNAAQLSPKRCRFFSAAEGGWPWIEKKVWLKITRPAL